MSELADNTGNNTQDDKKPGQDAASLGNQHTTMSMVLTSFPKEMTLALNALIVEGLTINLLVREPTTLASISLNTPEFQ